MKLPLFPLNSVLFPGGVLPLRIFEPRYLDMVKNCVKDNTEFVICLIREGKEVGQDAQHFNVGTACQIVDWETLPDGLLGVTAKGQRRVKITNPDVQSNNLLVGETESIIEEDDAELPEQFTEWAQLISIIMAKLGKPFTELERNITSSHWVAARLTEYLPFEVKVKQRILEIDHPLVRLEHLRESLNDIEHYYSNTNINK